ncbi:MAG: coiled-coil domain-containing protein [Thermodesulfobacteriota bacterium]|nr:coiled-coil domain-containing protein [Thermodesulfobacteriota bacterium]
MTTITFDTHIFIKKLKNIGCPEEQAEVHAEVLKDAFNEFSASQRKELATKQDLKNTELKLDARISEAKTEIIKWVAGMLIAQVAVGATLFKILS